MITNLENVFFSQCRPFIVHTTVSVNAYDYFR